MRVLKHPHGASSWPLRLQERCAATNVHSGWRPGERESGSCSLLGPVHLNASYRSSKAAQHSRAYVPERLRQPSSAPPHSVAPTAKCPLGCPLGCPLRTPLQMTRVCSSSPTSLEWTPEWTSEWTSSGHVAGRGRVAQRRRRRRARGRRGRGGRRRSCCSCPTGLEWTSSGHRVDVEWTSSGHVARRGRVTPRRRRRRARGRCGRGGRRRSCCSRPWSSFEGG